jgi:C1A family cysteine protease
MKSNRLKSAAIVLFWSILAPVAYSAPTCGNIFTSVMPFSVTSPGLMGKLLGSYHPSSDRLYAKYEEVLPYAKTNNDFMDLFASFRENKVSLKAQKNILQNHPGLKSLNAPSSTIDEYVQNYNQSLTERTIESTQSPLFQELRSEKVVDQCATGSCWINSSTSVLESVLKDATRADISEQYIYLQSVITRALSSAMKQGTMDEGGSLEEFMSLVKAQGYVLSSDWKPKSDVFQNKVNVHRMMHTLASKYRVLFSVVSQSISPEENILELKKDFMAEANEQLSKIFGPLPEQKQIKKLPPKMAFQMIQRSAKNYFFHQILDQIAGRLDLGQEVFISLNSEPKDFMQKDIVKQSSGVIDVSHAMAVVGYIKDSAGKVQLLKVKNSWGTGIGDQGFIYLSSEFLNQSFIYAGVIDKN